MSANQQNARLQACKRITSVDGSRNRRYSENVAKRRYYAAYRAARFAKRFGA